MCMRRHGAAPLYHLKPRPGRCPLLAATTTCPAHLADPQRAPSVLSGRQRRGLSSPLGLSLPPVWLAALATLAAPAALRRAAAGAARLWAAAHSGRSSGGGPSEPRGQARPAGQRRRRRRTQNARPAGADRRQRCLCFAGLPEHQQQAGAAGRNAQEVLRRGHVSLAAAPQHFCLVRLAADASHPHVSGGAL